MKAISAVLRAGLDNAYSKFGDNGVVDIGLQSALNVGVKPANYVNVPKSCLKAISYGDGQTITSIVIGPSDCRVGKAVPVIISGDWHKYNYGVKDIGEPTL